MINHSLITIKQIETIETYKVRHPVLRKGRPIEDCKFEGDDLSTTFHFGMYYKNKLIGVATFLENNYSLLTHKKQYQLRGMAILDEYQGFKLGKQLLSYGERLLKQKGVHTIWCNAREIAYNFYLNQGYSVIGETFVIPNIGLHYVMHKEVTKF